MTTSERIDDILSNDKHGIFRNELKELESCHVHAFKSIMYYEIIHYTDAELYYIGDETQKFLDESADLILNTEKGRVYLFK